MFEDHAATRDHLSNDGEEENYFVSMTDMLVGMLFLFVIMLMAFAINYCPWSDYLRQMAA